MQILANSRTIASHSRPGYGGVYLNDFTIILNFSYAWSRQMDKGKYIDPFLEKRRIKYDEWLRNKDLINFNIT